MHNRVHVVTNVTEMIIKIHYDNYTNQNRRLKGELLNECTGTINVLLSVSGGGGQ